MVLPIPDISFFFIFKFQYEKKLNPHCRPLSTFFFMPKSFFNHFLMAFPLKEESYVSSKRMLSGQNMESLQKLTLSGTHFHKIKRP